MSYKMLDGLGAAWHAPPMKRLMFVAGVTALVVLVGAVGVVRKRAKRDSLSTLAPVFSIDGYSRQAQPSQASSNYVDFGVGDRGWDWN